MDNDDPALTEQLQALKAQRSHTRQEIDLLLQATSGLGSGITNDKLGRLVELMRSAMASSEFCSSMASRAR